MRPEVKEKIKKAAAETRARRKNQRPLIAELKLQNLSRAKRALLERAFQEATWFYNWLIQDFSRLERPWATKAVELDGVRHEFTVLPSVVRTWMAARLRALLRARKTQRQNGRYVGRLKPKDAVNAIPFEKHGKGFRIDFERNRVRLQKLGWFRVLGLGQIPEGAEIANATLVRRPSGYYLLVASFVPKDRPLSPYSVDKDLGVDFGVGRKLTLSNGIRIDFEIPETRRLRRLQRRLARAQKGSKNYEKLRRLIAREHEKLARRRKDAENKILAYLRAFRRVAFQDDPVARWMGDFGKSLHGSRVGSLKARLKTGLASPIVLDRATVTTKECAACGRPLNVVLEDRKVRCTCGWECDRDVNAALVILRKGLGLSPDQAVGVGRPELTPLERELAARILGSNPYIRVVFPR